MAGALDVSSLCLAVEVVCGYRAGCSASGFRGKAREGTVSLTCEVSKKRVRHRMCVWDGEVPRRQSGDTIELTAAVGIKRCGAATKMVRSAKRARPISAANGTRAGCWRKPRYNNGGFSGAI